LLASDYNQRLLEFIMSRTVLRTVPAVALLALAFASGQSFEPRVAGQSGAMPSTRSGDWTHYTADVKGSRYIPLEQVNAGNFSKLEVAWRFKTDNLGTRPEYKLEGTPLAVRGVVYATGGTRRSVVSLDGATGELRWVYGLREGARAGIYAPRQLSGRGLSYWTDGKDERILYVTTGYRLVALDAKTGQPVQSFGTNGIVDLKMGAVIGTGQQIDLESGEIGLHATPTVTGNIVIVGSSFREGLAVKSRNNTKGLVRAFDVRTGKRLWQYNTIPRPGEFGSETWENDSWVTTGNNGVWTQITVDEEAGLVYLPVETPTSDLYGGHRPGNNLFAETLVAVDLKTGQRKWHFQFVHHPIWDHDMSSAALIADIVVDGKPIKAVAVPSKQGYLYVFDRITGRPVWPIPEVAVPQSTVPGEKTSPTQPIPSKPPAYSRPWVRVPDDVIDFTPELRAQGLDSLKWVTVNPSPYNPPVVSKVEGPIGALTIGTLTGGTNWPGATYDPELHTVFAPACNACISVLGLVQPPKELSDIDYIMGTAGQRASLILGGGEGSAADAPQRGRGGAPEPGAGAAPARGAAPPPEPAAAGRGAASSGPPPGAGSTVQGLSILKPPYGVITAVNLDKGEITWQVPHGETPDNVRNHPALKGLNIPRTGQAGNVGAVVTKTLVVVGDPQVTNPGNRPRGAMLRAYDKITGKQVGEVFLPAAQSGSPMSYMANGKQYIIVAVSGGAYSGEYIAFGLPDSELRPTQGQ
jgi:glucose dehydrogenase